MKIKSMFVISMLGILSVACSSAHSGGAVDAGASGPAWDGGGWQAVDAGTSDAIEAIASGDQGFVAGTDLGNILHSTDGLTWQSQASEVIGFTAATYIERSHKYVLASSNVPMGGAAGVLLNSTDGSTWTEDDPMVSPSAFSTTAGLSIIVGGQGRFATSSDDVIWTPQDTGDTWTLGGVAATSTTVVALGNNDNGPVATEILSTTNPPTSAPWNKVLSLPGQGLFGVTWSPALGRFVAVGSSGEMTGRALIASSPDGQTWSTTTTDAADLLNAVAECGGRLVAVGHQGGPSGVWPVIITSTDGVSWGVAFSGQPGTLGHYDLNAIACNATTAVAVGQAGFAFRSTF